MGVAVKTRMTEEEFMRMPDDGRKWELVNGEPKEVPTAHTHDILVGWLVRLLGVHADPTGFLAGSQAGFRMASGNIRCPDVSFFRESRLPNNLPYSGFGDEAPDLCIEIISPSEDQADMIQKVREYFGAGAEQVWHLFPEQKMVRVFLSPTVSAEYHENDEITGGTILPTFRCQVAELFRMRPKP